MTTGIKLTIAGVLVTAVTTFMAYQGAASSWQYYLTVDECTADAVTLKDTRLRVHGQVAPRSLQIAADRSTAQFLLVGEKTSLNVFASGPIPDNLKERMEVVVEGRLSQPTTLSGDRVLTKCSSKYQSAGSTSTPSQLTASHAEEGM